MTEFEIWYLIIIGFYLVVFYAMVRYVEKVSDSKFDLEKKYMDLLFKAMIMETEIESYKKKESNE